MTDRDRLMALSLAACLLVFWFASFRLGILPCGHGCYWCGAFLEAKR